MNEKVKVYRSIILPVVLYSCETWSFNLREERTLWVFENRVLGGIFGSKKDEVKGEWRKLHNEEPHRKGSRYGVLEVLRLQKVFAPIHY
jgi:hypothetical protein